jgi:hypothetical protein
MRPTDPHHLDFQIARAARAQRLWRAELRDGQRGRACPLVSSEAAERKTLEELRRLDDTGFGDPLRRWVLRLFEEKSCAAELGTVEYELRVRRHLAGEPARLELSLRELLERALRHAAETGVWLEQYLGATYELASASGALWRRRAELAEELNQDFVDALELPCQDPDRIAETWLADSADAYLSFAPHDLRELLVAAQAGAASDGWPGRLTPRTVVSLVEEPSLLRGVRLEFARVPRALGPASFIRALTALGACWSEALLPSQAPFVLVHDPQHLHEHTYGAVFGLLPLLPEFAKVRLGLSRSRAREHVRALAAAVLIEARALALRVLLRRPALRGEILGDAFEHWTGRAFGFRLDAPLAGAIFRLRFDDAQRLAGLFLAASVGQHLVETHDEDWFRNPRALEELRTGASAAGASTVTPELLAQGAQDLLRSLRERLR